MQCVLDFDRKGYRLILGGERSLKLRVSTTSRDPDATSRVLCSLTAEGPEASVSCQRVAFCCTLILLLARGVLSLGWSE